MLPVVSTGRQRPTCAFCPFNGRLSKEHFWGDWLRPHLRAFVVGNPKTKHTVSLTAASGDRVFMHQRKRGSLELRDGDARDQTLRVVCETCNNNWMSQLQTRAKPTILALVRGEWPLIAATERRALAAWCTMFSMVIEFADPPTRASTPAERAYLKERLEPPPNWTVWIGRALDGDVWRGAWNHFGMGAPAARSAEGAITRTGECDTQSTAAVANCFYFQTHSTRSAEANVDAKEFAAQHGLRILWPTPADDTPTPRPDAVLGALAADSASRAFVPPGFPVRYAWEF